MSIVFSSDKHYLNIALKIRKVLGIFTKYKPTEMAQEISNIPNMMDNYDSITNGAVFTGKTARMIGTKMYTGMFAGSDIETFEVPENITEIPTYSFYGSTIKSIILHDNITVLGDQCFCSCSNLTDVKFPKNLISIGAFAFEDTWMTDNIILPDSVMYIGTYAFRHTSIPLIDVSKNVSSIGTQAFANNEYLKTVILRKTGSVVTLGNVDVFRNTPIASGIGYIYVPSSLLNSYKTANDWSTFANQFRPLEDYTVDGTVTGEFDYSKI